VALTERYVSSLAGGGGDGSSGSPWTWAEMLTNAAAGDRCNVKADGTYARTTSTDATTNSGTAAQPIIIRGYATTIGDGNQGRTAAGVLVTTNMPSITYTTGRFSSARDYVIYESMNVSNATGINNPAFGLTGLYTAVVNCNVSHSGTGGANAHAVSGTGTGTSFIDCDASNTCTTASSAINNTGDFARVRYCRAVCTNGAAFRIGRGSLAGCIGYNSAQGIVNTHASAALFSVDSCTFYNCTDAYQGGNVAYAGAPLFTNCHITDCGQGFESLYVGTGNLALLRWYTRTRDNTSADSGFPDWPNYGPVTTDNGAAATDYVDAAGGDFRLVRTAAGAGAGWFQYTSIGAHQRRDNQPSTSIVQSGQTYGGYDGTDQTGAYSAAGGGFLVLNSGVVR
jgi:hypothetical protein